MDSKKQLLTISLRGVDVKDVNLFPSGSHYFLGIIR